MRDTTDNTHQSVKKRSILSSRIKKWAKGPVFASATRSKENDTRDIVVSEKRTAAGSVAMMSENTEEIATTSTAVVDENMEGTSAATVRRDESDVTLDERIEVAIEQGIFEKIRPLTEQIKKPGKAKITLEQYRRKKVCLEVVVEKQLDPDDSSPMAELTVVNEVAQNAKISDASDTVADVVDDDFVMTAANDSNDATTQSTHNEELESAREVTPVRPIMERNEVVEWRKLLPRSMPQQDVTDDTVEGPGQDMPWEWREVTHTHHLSLCHIENATCSDRTNSARARPKNQKISSMASASVDSIPMTVQSVRRNLCNTI